MLPITSVATLITPPAIDASHVHFPIYVCITYAPRNFISSQPCLPIANFFLFLRYIRDGKILKFVQHVCLHVRVIFLYMKLLFPVDYCQSSFDNLRVETCRGKR